MCVPICPFGALSRKDDNKKQPVVDSKYLYRMWYLCHACHEKTIIMKPTVEKGIPLDIHKLVEYSKKGLLTAPASPQLDKKIKSKITG